MAGLHGYGSVSDNIDNVGEVVVVPGVICFAGRNDISVDCAVQIEIAFFAILLGNCPFYMLGLHL